ncbi:MAG TPA: serine/threonine-protein kinase [bacterium]|nr:serine/threonine-protein kinase [bacterium]
MKRAERYEVLETIQEGMVAMTYKAKDRVLDRNVLLKVLHPRLTADTDLVQRFRREALLQARLKHPGIVTVYDFGTDDDFYIASEFIEGRTLDALLAEKGHLTLAELTPIVLAVARALAYAHGQDVIHRDLKPANIMISDTGEVKLTDFGLACARDFGELTQEGCVIGTPSYMSPEQARGQRVDAATDIFALGIVIYQSLSRLNPFAASNYADALSLVLNHQPRPLAELVGGLPAGLSDLVTRMLAKDATTRPHTADELVRLLNASDGQRQASSIRRRTPSRSGVWLAACGLLIAAVAVSLVVAHSRHAGDRSTGEGTSLVADTSYGRIAGSRDSSGPVTETRILDSSTTRRLSGQPPVSGMPSTELGTTDVGIATPNSQLSPPAECRLRITVTPWADVAIDGKSLGATPLSTEPVLPQGRHVVTLLNPYYPEVSRTLLMDQPSCTLAVNLDREVANVDISVTPWAVVAIDGRIVDTTPMDHPIRVSLGSHDVTLTHPELGIKHEVIRTDSARAYRFSYDMAAR